MRSIDWVVTLAAVIAIGGVGPMGYMLLGQLKDRRARRAAEEQMQGAQKIVAELTASDAPSVAKALSRFDKSTIDRTVEGLISGDDSPARMAFIGQLAIELGVLERYLDRARNARSWSERAHAVRLLGRLAVPSAAPVLAGVLRDRYEDESVRTLAADALATIRDPAAVPLLIGELRQVDEHATPRVAEALIRFGKLATPGLIELLAGQESPPPARVWAARILGATRDTSAVEPLIARLRDRHDLLRAATAEALGAIGERRALQLLIQAALRDPAPQVRAEAASAVAKIAGEEASEVLVAALGDPDFATRLRALEAFENMRLADTSALEKALGDVNAEVSRRAALALERLGYLDRLVDRLASEERKTRAAAYDALMQLGRAGLVDGIAARIRHESMLVRAAIAKACGELGEERAGTALLDALDDPAWPVRATLAEALGRLRPAGGSSALIKLLSDPEESVREAAAEALTAYAGSEVDASQVNLVAAYEGGGIPVRLAMVAIAARIDDPSLRQLLVQATGDPSEAVRLQAVEAIAARPHDSAVPALVTALRDTSVDVRLATVPALGAVGSAEAIEALLHALPGAEPSQRERIAEALAGVGRHHLLRKIEEHVRSPVLDVRLGMAWALGKIGDASGVPVLAEFLRDADAQLRASAAGALGKIPGTSTVATLLTAMEDRDPKTRAAVVNALGRCGAGDARVRAGLEGRIFDPDAFVRNRAAIALARAFGAEAAALSMSKEVARLLGDGPLVIMQGLAGTEETIALALQALADPSRLDEIQSFFEREEPAICSAFLASLKLSDPADAGLRTQLDPVALTRQYEKLLRSSRNVGERRAAIEALARIGKRGNGLVFAEALAADPAEAVRLRSAEVLSQLVDEDVARAALIRAMGDPHPQVAIASVRSLRGRREPEVALALYRRLGAGAAAVNRVVEEALADCYRDDLVAFLDKTMAADRPEAIVAAIRVLESMGHEGSLSILTHHLESKDAEIRAAAVRAMARLTTKEAGPRIGKMFDDPHESVRLAALEVTAEQGPASVVRMASLRVDPSVRIRVRLCQVLERFPGAATWKVLEAFLDDASASVRASALLSLLSFADAEGVRRFTAYLEKASLETRRELGLEVRAAAITHKLAGSLVSSGDGAMREFLVMAVAAIGSEGYEKHLLPVLRDPRSTVRLAAARALASSPSPDVRLAVRELLEDPELAVREAIRDVVSTFREAKAGNE